MRRREFITLLGGAAAVWPFAAHAQQPARLPTIGFMGESTLAGQRPWVAAFVERLRELSWIEGRNVAIEYRWAEGSNERFPEIVTELIRNKVDVILTQGTPVVLAAKQATLAIPIVFAIAGNPVANGLVATLARPGGNVTGLSNQTADLAGKIAQTRNFVGERFAIRHRRIDHHAWHGTQAARRREGREADCAPLLWTMR